MAYVGEISGSIPLQFPQPSRPSHEFDIDYLNPDEFLYDGETNDSFPTSLREFIEELDHEGRQVLKKLAGHIPIHRILRENLHAIRAKKKPVSEVLHDVLGKFLKTEQENCDVMERGVNEDGRKEKLERFKVKAVNIVGLGDVKEEENQH